MDLVISDWHPILVPFSRPGRGTFLANCQPCLAPLYFADHPVVIFTDVVIIDRIPGESSSGGCLMHEVTRILHAIDQGDSHAAEQLLPLVYDELRRLAADMMVHEKPGQTLQATALVHEAYLRLVGGEMASRWDSRGHFFAAASEAMRRILVDNVRRKASSKRGGSLKRQVLDEAKLAAPDDSDELVALDEALTKLAEVDSLAAELVKLRFFAGFTMDQAAAALGISPRSAYYVWTYARSWLHRQLREE